MIVRRAFSPPDNERLAHVCGVLDENLRAIEQGLNVVISRRQEHFRVEGGKLQAPRALALIEALYERSGRPIDEEQLQLMLYEAQRDVIQGHAKPVAPAEVAAGGEIVLHTRRANLIGRTPNQVQYLRQILSHDITLGLGPAGTGKTFLAVACAVDALERASVQRIVLTRPAVEAGERLGFLPGDLSQKVDPYLRPLYDALYEMLGFEKVAKLIERNVIEIAPLAYMRGRTLNDSYVILDEAQNTTVEQMKMFLTRIGFGTVAVITGDVTQVDLPRSTLMTWLNPDCLPCGRSVCVTSPVTTALEPKPMRVRNIFICSLVVFCASSRITNESFNERPRMNASGATSITLRSINFATRSKPNISYKASYIGRR